VTGGWRNSLNELHNIYSSPNIKLIKSRKMMWVGHVVHMEEMRGAYKISVRNLKGRDHLEI
jgi:hypothetical protein